MKFGLFVAAILAATPVVAAPIEVRTYPIDAFEVGQPTTTFGDLTFLGGFQIVSADPDFGSLSGIDFFPDGRTFAAVADTGFWFTAKLDENEDRPTGISNASWSPMLGLDGLPPKRKVDTDAESVRLVAGADGSLKALVSFEQTPSVRAFAGPDIAAATPTKIRLPKYVNNLRRNLGLEGIAVAPSASPLAGAIVLTAERSLDANGDHRAFVLSGKRAGQFSIRRSEEYDISDAAFLPGGDLLILERRFSFSGGFGLRIRRIDGNAIRPGATLDGHVVIEADARYQIDNLEGLAVRATPDGRAILTLVSDDNNTFLQRTLLLQFRLNTAP